MVDVKQPPVEFTAQTDVITGSPRGKGSSEDVSQPDLISTKKEPSNDGSSIEVEPMFTAHDVSTENVQSSEYVCGDAAENDKELTEAQVPPTFTVIEALYSVGDIQQRAADGQISSSQPGNLVGN